MDQQSEREVRVTRVPLARGPVAGAVVAQLIVLALTINSYGYHRDELYFRMLRPGWGYIDQPPLTPLLVRGSDAIFGDHLWALRIPALIAAAVSVVLVAAIAREVGGTRTAQALAAWGYAFASFPLILGHVLLTTSIDEPVWLGVLLLVIRAVLSDRPRCWIWAGVLVGLGSYNKLLVITLLAALAVGVLVTGPRRLLVSRPVLLGALAAVVVGLPNILYQATNGWPQLEFGRQLSAHNAGEVHSSMWYLAILLLGPPLTVIWIAGTVALLRRPTWRPIRFVGMALPVLLVLVFVMGSQPYYEFGLIAGLFAIGCVPTTERLARDGRRAAGLVTLVAINAVVSALIGLPFVPVRDLHATPIPGINQTARDTVGWPTYVAEVATAYRRVPAAQRSATAVVASNYGEAGALDRYGPALGLPRIYSAQNQLYFQGRPPDTSTTAVIVGGEADFARTLFDTCRHVGRLDNRLDVDNEEQGEPIVVCDGPVGGWSKAWPELKHED